MRERSAARWVGVFFAISLVSSLTLTVVYALGGQTQLEGLSLGLALGALGAGLIIWAKAFLPIGGQVQMRGPLEPEPGEEDAAEETLEKGIHEIGRRRFLVGFGTAAAASLGVAALFPLRSLGGRPGLELVRTAWADGVRVVDSNGDFVTADDVEEGQVITVFPEGNVGSGDAVAVLIGLPPGVNHPIPGREGWILGGLVAYSKLCTHVGCPVGLYEPTTRLLFCPCHQSVFDIPEGARPIGGPATRALPQLPIGVDQDGLLVARGDFSEAPGPGFWWRPGHD
jgi:ubiquinol-cytochrome c reductase iron-sulfur subunit